MTEEVNQKKESLYTKDAFMKDQDQEIDHEKK
jgi:hypothetical protein